MLFQVSRPDGKTESLGLSVLDEPCAKQSDRTVLDLQIRAVSKQTAVKPMVHTHRIINVHIITIKDQYSSQAKFNTWFGWGLDHPSSPHQRKFILKACWARTDILFSGKSIELKGIPSVYIRVYLLSRLCIIYPSRRSSQRHWTTG